MKALSVILIAHNEEQAIGRMLVLIDSTQLVRAINLSIAANINLFLFYGVLGQRINNVIAGVDMTLFFALANIGLFAGLLLHTFRGDGVRCKFSFQ